MTPKTTEGGPHMSFRFTHTGCRAPSSPLLAQESYSRDISPVNHCLYRSPCWRLMDDFSANGFTKAPIRAFDESKASVYLQKLQEYESAVGEIKGVYRFQTHLILPWVTEIISSREIVDAAARVLGTDDLLVWFTEWHIKQPQTPGHYTWHQDAAYAGLSPPEDVVTAWIALTESDRRNGCVTFIEGSHKKGLKHLETPDPTNLLMLGQYIPDDLLNLEKATPVDLRPGEATLHAFRCVHASGPNTDTERRRIGLAIRYMKPRVKQLGSLKEGAMLVKGTDRCGNFELRLPPSTAMAPEGWAMHAREMEVMNTNYLARHGHK